MRRVALITVVLSLILTLSLGVRSQDDRDTDQISIQFLIDETVVVVIREGLITRTIDIEDITTTGQRYVDFGRFEVLTGAITDYELRAAARAEVRKGIFTEEIDVEPLQLRLVNDEIRGHPPTEINGKITDFIDAVRFPNSHWLFSGTNNVEGDRNTIVPIEARVDLGDLPGEVLSTGSQVVFTISFIVIER